MYKLEVSYRTSQNPDFNAESQLGLGIYKVTQAKGTRVNSYTAFIEPLLRRANLTIMTNARVQSIEIEGDSANQLKLQVNGIDKELFVIKRLLLCAGAIESPRILLSSGIGDREELKELGITCQHNVPGVGENLQDHLDYNGHCSFKESRIYWSFLEVFIAQVFTSPFNYFLGGWAGGLVILLRQEVLQIQNLEA